MSCSEAFSLSFSVSLIFRFSRLTACEPPHHPEMGMDAVANTAPKLLFGPMKSWYT